MKTGPFVRAPGRVTGFTVDSSLLVIRARNFERRGALYWLIKNECRGEREEQRDIYSRVAMREGRSNFIEGYRAFTTWSRHLFPLRLLNGELWRSRQNFAHTTDVTANNSEMHRVCHAKARPTFDRWTRNRNFESADDASTIVDPSACTYSAATRTKGRSCPRYLFVDQRVRCDFMPGIYVDVT